MAPGLYRAMAASVLSVGKAFSPPLSTPSRGKVIKAVKSDRPLDAHKVELFGVQALKLVTLFARDQV